jgi:F0F1-type ATP synthase membrane subunit a
MRFTLCLFIMIASLVAVASRVMRQVSTASVSTLAALAMALFRPWVCSALNEHKLFEALDT